MNYFKNLRVSLSSIAGILLSIVVAGESSAYVLLSSHWTPPTNHWNLGGFNATNQAAFIEAMNKWNGESNFSFTSSSSNISPCDSVPAPDGQSGVRFDADDCGRGFGATTLAVTWTWSSGSNTLNTDMVYNTAYTWGIHDQAASSTGVVDFRRVSVHELGHALGLGHETVNAAIMQPIYGDVLGPLTDDINGLVAIYGALPPPGDTSEDFLLMVMPPVLAAIGSGTPPQWGAYTELCCSTSSLTYRVTQSSQSRSSTLSSCSGTPTFNGYLPTTPGSKFFSHRTTSSTCGVLTASGSQNLLSGKRYTWVAEFNSGNPRFVLYSQNISSASGTMSATNFSSSTPGDMVVEATGPLLLEQDGDGQASFQRLEGHRALP